MRPAERQTGGGATSPIRGGAAIAAALAAIAAAPSLLLPFVSDDWVHLWAADRGIFLENPFRFFRPLCSLSYWIDWSVWGRTPAAFHATNVLLAAAAAALVVVAARRFTGDAALATGAGVAFALHPHHVGTVSWIAARSDLLAAVLVLATLAAYERWRASAAPRALPWGAMALFAAALASKETAATAPVALAAIALLRGTVRGSVRGTVRGSVRERGRTLLDESLRGLAPLFALALVHFAVVRPLFMTGETLNHLKWIGAWKGSLLSYATTAIVPPPQEIFERDPFVWAAVALAVVAVLAVAARLRNGALPRVVWPAGLAFVALLGPSVIGFQIRYAYLPVAAALVALVALLRAAGPRAGGAVAALLLVGWGASTVDAWKSELAAAEASRALIGGLVRESRAAGEAGAPALVPIGIPHRVRGVPVTTDYDRVIPFLGGAEGVRIVTAGEFDLPGPTADAVRSVERAAGEPATRVELEATAGVWSRMARPLRANRIRPLDHPWGSMRPEWTDDGRHRLSVTVRDGAAARAVVWTRGRLVPLDQLPAEGPAGQTSRTSAVKSPPIARWIAKTQSSSPAAPTAR